MTNVYSSNSGENPLKALDSLRPLNFQTLLEDYNLNNKGWRIE